MEPSIYSFSLCAALPLMLFFGFYFLFAKTPEKKIFKNYLRSRQIMGIAMLLLSANYSVHFFFGIRFKNADSSILMNMSTYFLCYSLFSSALIMLLDRFYITKRRVWTHIILWIIFSTLSGVVLFLLPSGIMQKISLFALAVWLIVFGVVLARRVIIAYRRAIRIFNETQADDIGAYIEWLSIFTYWAVIFGVGCGLLTFLPDKYVFIWVFSSILFYSYLFHCYQNYLLFYEQVENAFEQDIQSEEELLTNSGTEPEMVSEEEVPVSYTKDEFLDNQRVTGNIFNLLDAAMAFFFKHLSLSGKIEGLYREEELNVPYKALRECCINAFAHRVYHRPGSSVGIAIYDDRVEIENSGTFPPDITIEKLLGGHNSEPQNLIVANVLYKSAVLESWGRGIALMVNECRRVGIPDPEFHTDGNAVWIVFHYTRTTVGQDPTAPPQHPHSTPIVTPQ